MPNEFDRTSIEQVIKQAKQTRAKHMAQFWGPAFKAVGGLFLLLASLLPSLKGGSGA